MNDKIQENPISRSSNVDHEPGTKREISKEERKGVSSTDLEPEPALGVGASVSRRGEEIGGRDKRTKGESRRPVGTSTARDSSAVDPQEPMDDDSPTMPSGDQGG